MRTERHIHTSDSRVPGRIRSRNRHLLLPGALTAATLAVAAACSDTTTAPLASASASAASAPTGQPTSYTIREIGTFGGSFSIAFNINNAGDVSGAATTPDENQHAFQWERGQMTDLGTLGGLNSQGAGGALARAVAVLSETAATDPLQENFCGFGTDLVCAAAIWRHGTLSPLPTLGGGVNAAALTSNAAGQVVGLSDDGTLDASCLAPQKSHFQAVTWSAEGAIQKLPPLPGDEVGMALRGNDNGQVAGTSGLCSNTQFGGFGFGPHAVLWDHGSPIDLGSLGGSGVGLAAGVNNRGQVIGAASSPDGTAHPFLWTSATGMRDLGLMSTDPADAANTPFQINDRGQMVGASCDAPFGMCRGYLWQNGVMTDINDLLPPDSPLYVILPQTINESGQIAGLALVLSTGEVHAFIATPASRAAAAHGAARRVRLPASARATLRRMLGGRGH